MQSEEELSNRPFKISVPRPKKQFTQINGTRIGTGGYFPPLPIILLQ